MKRALILSLIAIVLLIGLSVLLCRFASKKAGSLMDIAIGLPENINDVPQGDIKQLVDEWEQNRKILSLLIKKDYIINADLAVHTLESTSVYGTECEYLCSKKALIVSLETLLACLGLSPQSYL